MAKVKGLRGRVSEECGNVERKIGVKVELNERKGLYVNGIE